MNAESSTTDIAIIGMSALFPGAKDLQTYWQNIFNKVDAVQDAPDEWVGSYFDPNSTENDRIYTRKGGFLGKLAQFNPTEFGIMPNSVNGIDPDNFLALKLARDALWDAGYKERPFNRETTGIILGRGTYLHRGNATWLQHGMVVEQTLKLLHQLHPELEQETLNHIRQELKADLPPFNGETVPGLVPNVITGRIANRLDLMGPNYLVDAACASSLIAIESAIKELLSDRCDMMLAGGIHSSTPPQSFMMFCQVNALTRSKIRPFDKSADGTLLGEGLGIVVLKRLAKAQQDGDRIYAVIKAMGSSSDGKALGLLAPRFEGEVLTLQRAYTKNGINPETVALIEAHGTGTPLGDRTEIQSLTHIFGQRQGEMPGCALGSVKSMIAHCLPAAGAAAIIKTALALYHKVLPPTLCDEVNPDLEIEKTPFYINNETRPWIHGRPEAPRRAGVNAFGFGGINAHAVLEEYTEPQTHSIKQLHQQWPTELLIFCADQRTALIDLIHNIQNLLQANPNLTLANLAYTLSTQANHTHRLAVIAKDIPDLQNKLTFAEEKLKDPKRTHLQTRTGIYYKEPQSRIEPGKTAFLFPGEGSQYPNMLADLCLYFPKVREWFDFLDETFASTRKQLPSSLIFPPPTSLTKEERDLATKQLFHMNVGSEIVSTASMALHDLLRDLDIQCDFMVGHSTGEFAALVASGVVRLTGREELKEKNRLLNRIYQDLEAKDSIPKGRLMTVGGVNLSVVEKLVDASQGRLYLAMDNCPNQAVLFGSESDVEAVAAQLKTDGAICLPLPFDRAYHTPLFAGVGTAFRSYYDALEVGKGHTCLYSCATSEAFPDEPEAIRALAAQQWSSRVHFRKTIEKLYNEGVRTFIEVGPNSNLTAFVDDTLRDRTFLAVASNHHRQSGLEAIQHLLARLFVNGIATNMAVLYQHRDVTAISLEASIAGEYDRPKEMPILDYSMPEIELRSQVIETIVHKLRPPESTKNRETVISAVMSQNPVENRVSTTTPNNPADDSVRPTPHYSNGNSVEKALEVEPAATTSNLSIQPTPIAPNIGPSNTVQIPAPSSISHLPTDTRLSLLMSHFDLMQEFLANQGRVTAMLYSTLGTSGNAEATLLPTNLAPTALTQEDAWPLLGQMIERDDQHLWCDRTFDMEHDIFLHDHTIGGKLSQQHPELFPLPVIPFTISMEILAEAATCLVGPDKVVIGLDNLRGYRWIALDQGQISLNIQAQIQPQPDPQTWCVHVQLFESGTAQATPVFEGDVRLANQFPLAPAPVSINWQQPAPSAYPDTDLYRTGMFHGPRFQGVKHICQWDKQGIEADLQVIPIDDFFQQIHHPIFQIDAGLLDAAGQLVGYWVLEQIGTDFNVFPFNVQSFHQYQAPLPANSPVLCRGLMRFTSETQTEAIFDFLDETGHLIARLEGWQDRFFPVPHKYYQCRLHPQTAYLSDVWMQEETGIICRRIEPFPEHFLEDGWSIWKRVLAHLMLNEQERKFWYELPEKGPGRTDWLLGRIAAKDALRQWAKQTFNVELAPIDIEILSTPLGKPMVRCPQLEYLGSLPDISISHSRGYIVAAVAKPNLRIGIDIERLDWIRSNDWLGAAFTKQELDLIPQQDSLPAILGLWCAKETAAKAAGTGLQGNPYEWQITHYSMDGQQITVSHGSESFHVNLWYRDDEILAICQT
ncbi:MAG TPA: 6-deoxyerythronolide-B synthase [Cyanobacteria bacterium UBA8543]|nr:6-deoxyerythronolide-B synthase [Cyanobacteria bacterium UBA8543]